MIDGIIGILDSDYDYGKNFIDCLSSHSRLTFEFRLFSDRNALLTFNKPAAIRILFISEDYKYDEEILALKTYAVLIVLSGDGVDTCIPDVPVPDIAEIFKYRSPDDILKEALKLCAPCDTHGHISADLSGINGRQSFIVGIYSPLGNCYKTSFAMAYAMCCAKTSSVLFLSFDISPGFGLFSGADCECSDMGDLIFHYNNTMSCKTNASDNFSAHFNSIIRTHGGIDYIVPARYESDIRALDSKTFSNIIDCISHHTDYDNIVIDFGTKLPDIESLLEIPSVIYMPVLSDFISSRKVSSFLYALDNHNKEHLKTRISQVTLPPFSDADSVRGFTTYHEFVSKSGLFSLAESCIKGGNIGSIEH